MVICLPELVNLKEETFNRKVDSLRKTLISSPDIYTFTMCSPISLIKDVHMSGETFEDHTIEMFKSTSFFPFPVFIEKERVFILLQRSYSIYAEVNDQKQTGILTVNSFSISEEYL